MKYDCLTIAQTSKKGKFLERSSSSDLIGSCTGLRENCECGMCFIIADDIEVRMEKESSTLTFACCPGELEWVTLGSPAGCWEAGTHHLKASPQSVEHPSESTKSRECRYIKVRQGILASSRCPAKGIRKDWSLQGRLSWEKKTFMLLSSFQVVQCREENGAMTNLGYWYIVSEPAVQS